MSFFASRRRAALRAKPLSEELWATIDHNVPYVRGLDADTRRELGGLIQIFLAEKHFEGCAGLSLTDEIRATIAAQACILLLHRESDVYPTVDTVLVYPTAYRAPPPPAMVFTRGPQVEAAQTRTGEMSWKQGIVVVAWDHVRTGSHGVPEGENLVVHEFAHAIDSEDGAMDGAPPLSTRARYQRWAEVLGDEYAELTRRLAHGEESDIRPYGATNEREFFAVVSEQFFEAPHEMKRLHPKMYEELAHFYKQDPVSIVPARP